MRLAIDVVLDYSIEDEADILLQIEVAAMADQRIERETLTVTSAQPLRAITGEDSIGQRTLAHGSGWFRAEYSAIVSIERASVDLAPLPPTPVRDLPAMVLPYILPSRYCEGERFERFVTSEFGDLQGGARAMAMRDWVEANLCYAPGTSTGVTTAMMTFAERQGVCRDYAHLLTSLCRASAIPARCVSAYAPGVKPQDFHAVTEAWLDGGWHLLDGTGMAHCNDLARVSVGRDATDIAFMTIFGRASLQEQRVSVRVA